MKKKALGLTFFFLTFFFISAYGSFAADYYVSQESTAADNNAGSIDKPWKTLQSSINKLKAGDNLFVKAGTYSEKISIAVSGQPNNYITIQNFATDRVVISGTKSDGTEITSSPIIVHITNVSYLKFKGFEIMNTSLGNTPSGIFVEGQGDGLQILNNKISNVTWKSGQNAFGVAFYGNGTSGAISNLLVDGNEVFNCKTGQSETMTFNGNINGFIVRNNYIHDDDNIGICLIGFEGTSTIFDQARNGLVEKNRVINVSSKSNSTYKGDCCAGGIYTDGGRDSIIQNNYVDKCDLGIEVESEHLNGEASGMIVKNNLITNCDYTGLYFGGYDSNRGLVHDCTFNNNTLYNNNEGIIIAKAQNNNVFDNIIYGGNPLLEEDKMTYNGATVGTAAANNFHHNLWYDSAGNSQSLTKFGDPKFVNPSALDFSLQSTSPAINAGDPLYVPAASETDYFGAARIANTIVDIGASEYGSIAPPPTSAITVSNVASSSTSTSSAIVAWTTNVAADSQVEYGTSTAYGTLSPVNSTMVTSHSISLSNLAAGTAYHFRVLSKNAAGVVVKSGDFTFTTQSITPPPTPSLTISNVASSSISTSSAIVAWSTNVTADSQVEYGTSTAYGTLSAVNSVMVTSHSISLSNLAASTAYHFRVLSKNTAGVVVKSGDNAFSTIANPGPSPDTDVSGKFGHASNIPINTIINSKIDFKNDVDWFKFTATAAGTYTVTFVGTENTWCELDDSHGDSMPTNSTEVNGLFTIKATLKANTIYSIYIDGSKVCNYSLIVAN